MRLSKLEIYGFKSFARRTEIVFPQNVTGIVGPNGSGKSNISDAVRWVLGEQSAKTLRGNSMSDVIFNGTEQRKPMNYCEVTLVFENADRQLPVDFAEVSITRRVYRSGESEYLMNGAACRLRDVVDLFRDTGVGKEGYSIIGQGRIDEILSQRGEDRRAVFEEAAGISRFKARKEEAEQRLKRADENLVRVTDVLEELTRQLVPLEKQSAVAKEYLALSSTLKELDIQLYLLRYERFEKRAATMDDALLAVRQALEAAQQRLEETAAERDRQESKVSALQQALSAAHDELLNQTELLHRTRERAQSVANRLQTSTETADRLAQEAEAIRSRMRLIEATLTQSDGGLSEADRALAAARTQLDERRQTHEQVTQAAQKWEDELTRHKTDMLDRMTRMQDVRTAQARQSAMQGQMTARRAELSAQLETEDEKETALVASVTEAQGHLSQEQERQQALQADAEQLEERTQELLQGILTGQKVTQEAEQAARGMEARLKTLRELQEGYEGYQYPVRQALTYAKKAGLAGVRDVVAMLLSVPKQYETALDMALGGAMQNIVTETEQDAKALIDYLRANRLGRATFLPLSAVRGRTLSAREREVLRMPGCVGVASELCGYDEAYRPIFENLLGRTIIAKDLDSGIAIMRAGGHAFRLVTLAGDVMHSGGSMTGGSIQQKAQNLLGREREIKELEAALAEKVAQARTGRENVEQQESERKQLKEQRDAAQYALHQQEIAVVRDTERLKAAQAELDEHRATAEGLRQAVAQLTESLTGIEEELKRIEERTGQEQTDTESLNARTEELSRQLDQARREREAAQEALTAALLRAQEAEHDCDRLRRDKHRLLGDSEDCQRELQTTEAKRQAALTDIKKAEEESVTAAETVTLAQQQEADARACVNDTEQRRDEAQRALKDLQNELEAGQLLVGRETDRLHRQEMNIARVRADWKQLDDRLWDAYELTYAGAQDAHAEYVLIRRGELPAETVEQLAARQTAAQRARATQTGQQTAADEADADAAQSNAVDPLAADDAEALAPQPLPAPPDPTVSTAQAEDRREWFPVAADFDENAADAQAQGIRERIRAMGSVNVSAIEEFAALHARHSELSAQRDDLEQAKTDLQQLIQRLLEHMRTVFVQQFEVLQGYFAETFTRLFGGGHGEIALSDPDDPLNCGIEIIVQPPGKKRQILSLFSGGERALTAIAILFAMLKLKPTPFCILDEIEAALDEANITYFADYLKEFSQSTQFVVVTHRKGTMERCDTLFGVAMEERGVSSMVSVSLTDYE